MAKLFGVVMNDTYLTLKLNLPFAKSPLEKDFYAQMFSMFLWNKGVAGVEIRDDETFMEWDKDNKPVFDHIEVKAYFNEVKETESLLFDIKRELKNIISDEKEYIRSIDSLKYEINKNEDWKNEWKKFFKPLKLTQHIIVKPEWEQYDKKNNEIVLNINPDMAFGTGLHETTKLVSNVIEKILLDDKNENIKTMLDVGAGTGILGISASKLKNDLKVDLIEIDKNARKIAKENILKNNTPNVVMKDILIEEVNGKYDLVVANIISSILYEIKNELFEKTKNILVLSGIQKKEKEEFIENFSVEGFKLIDSSDMNDWSSLTYIKE